MFARPSTALLGMLLAALVMSCQSTPATTAPPASPVANTILDLPPVGNGIALGSVHVRLDPAAGTVSAGETRVNQAIGDAYLVGLNALNCNCFTVESVSRSPIPGGTRVALGVAFKHPFPLAARPDLFGWDLKAILASDINAVSFPASSTTVSAGFMANAAGYTGEWTEQLQSALPTLTSTVFPYVILGEDRAATAPFQWQNPTGWNVFPSGGTNTGEIQLDVSGASTVEFDLFFTVGYQASATRATRQTPDYQPPRGNARAPWRVDAALTNNLLSVATGSSVQLDLAIWDWQHGQSLGSDVTTASVSAPALFTGAQTVTLGGGTGRDLTPLTGSTLLVNTMGTATAGTVYALVEVQDALFGANPGGAGSNPGSTKIEDDFTTVAPYDDVRTFQVVPLTIGDTPNTPPIAALTTTPPRAGNGSLTVNAGVAVTFDAATSSDPDAPASPNGDLVLFEYDWQWDGILANFVADESYASAAPPVAHTYAAVVTTKMGLGVTDGAGARTILTVDVTVNPASPFVLNLDPIQDIVSVPDNYEERGAALTEESDGEIVITYVASHVSGAGRYCPGYRSTYGGGVFSTGVDVVGGYPQVLSNVEAGYYLKAFPNWGSDNTLYEQFFTDYITHAGNQTTNGLDFNLGYPSPVPGGPPISCAGFIGYNEYSADFAISRVGGGITVFADKSTSGALPPTISAYLGGPADWCVPTAFWVGSVPSSVVDARPSELSHWRSTAADSVGGIHVAYRAQNGTRLTSATSSAGAVAGFVTTDLATGSSGEFKDPTLDLDDNAGMYLVTVRFTGGNYRLISFKSTDKGATWGAQTQIGATFATEPAELAVSARVISGRNVIGVGYVVAGQQWVRYSVDGGASWNDLALSTGGGDYSAEILIDRQTGDFYSAYSTASHQLKARHGLFS
ncbi:MAG: sialidase family protein [bacterium]